MTTASSGARPEEAESALARWGLTLEDVRAFIPRCADDETLMLVGSVAAGLASGSSDIDLLMIADRSDVHEGLVLREADFDASVLRHPDGYRLNVEVWGAEHMEDVERRFASAIGCLLEPRVIHDLHVMRTDEVMVMHRLRTGIVLANPTVAERWRTRLRLEGLPTYVMLVAAWYCFAHTADVGGELEAGEVDSAVWMMQTCIDQLAAALLASVGETNPSQRWRVRLLRRHRAELGPKTVDSLIRYLFLQPATGVEAEIEDALRFARARLRLLLQGSPELEALMSSLATGEAGEALR